MSKDRIIELELDTMAHGGQAIGRFQGQVIFCPDALPGEVVRVRVTRERKRWARARLLSVLQVSPQRVDPPCPYYGLCGGCQWQHIAYEAQLSYKREIVIDQLRRLGGISEPPVREVIGMDEPWAYRNHAQFGITPDGRPGFLAAKSHDVVPVEHCMLLHPYLDDMHAALDLEWPDLKQLSLRAGIHTGERLCVLEIPGDDLPEVEIDLDLSVVLRLSDGRDVALIGRNVYHEMLDGKRFQVSAASFFQVNTEQAQRMIDTVRAFLAPEADDVLLDLYCGVGTIGLSLHDEVRGVIGVEGHPAAVADARVNGEGKRATFFQGSARATLPKLTDRITKAVLDPPRTGCDPRAMEALLDTEPERIVYVSCDPATLARDAHVLSRSGYQLLAVQPIDMFPQTYHIETVSLWRRNRMPPAAEPSS